MTSKCGKNKKAANEPLGKDMSHLFLSHFDFFCDVLMSKSIATYLFNILVIEIKNVNDIIDDCPLTDTVTTTTIIFIFLHFKMLFGLQIASANLGGPYIL